MMKLIIINNKTNDNNDDKESISIFSKRLDLYTKIDRAVHSFFLVFGPTQDHH